MKCLTGFGPPSSTLLYSYPLPPSLSTQYLLTDLTGPYKRERDTAIIHAAKGTVGLSGDAIWKLRDRPTVQSLSDTKARSLSQDKSITTLGGLVLLSNLSVYSIKVPKLFLDIARILKLQCRITVPLRLAE